MAKKKVREAGKSLSRAQGESRVPRNTITDAAVIFLGGLVLALFLQKAAFYYDWDTLDSVLRMNLPGYNPVSVPPVKYHLLIEPAVYAITSALDPLLGSDHMIGFTVLVAIFSAGLLALTYYTVRALTGNRAAAIVSVVFLAVSYNFLFLTFSIGQNQINQFFNLLSVLLALALLGKVGWKVDRRVLAAALGGSIGLAVGTNIRSLYLLLLLPLLVLFSSDRKASLRDVAVASLGALVCIACLAAASNALGLSTGVTGFFTVVYYDDPQYWFFSGHTSLQDQATAASIGLVRSFLGDRPASTLLEVSQFLPIAAAIALIGIFVYVLRGSARDPVVLLVATLLVINSVHSFFYEPASVERWDHATLYCALLAGLAWASPVDRYGKIAIAALVLIMFAGLFLTAAGAGTDPLYLSFLYGKLPADSFSQHPGLLVITPKDSMVTGKYMVYRYGKEHVVFSGQFGSPNDLAAFVAGAHSNSTLYLDYQACQTLDGLNGTAPVLDAVVPVDEEGIWYRADKGSAP